MRVPPFQQRPKGRVTVNSYRSTSSNDAQTQGFQDGLVVVDAVELVRRIVDVEDSRSFADAKYVARLPRRLAFHRPSQAFQFPGRQTGIVELRRRGQQDSQRNILGMNSKELEVGDDSCHF